MSIALLRSEYPPETYLGGAYDGPTRWYVPQARRSQNGLLDNKLTSSYPISVLSTAIDRSRRVESSHATPRTGGTREVDFLSFLASKYDRFSVGSKNRTGGY